MFEQHEHDKLIKFITNLQARHGIEASDLSGKANKELRRMLAELTKLDWQVKGIISV